MTTIVIAVAETVSVGADAMTMSVVLETAPVIIDTTIATVEISR